MVTRVEIKQSVAQVAIQPTAKDLSESVKYEALSTGHRVELVAIGERDGKGVGEREGRVGEVGRDWLGSTQLLVVYLQ